VTDNGEGEEHSPSCPWQAAVASALADGAISGVLIYEIEGGGKPGRILIRTGLASAMGLCEYTIQEIVERDG
jgi:hypothetical protein